MTYSEIPNYFEGKIDLGIIGGTGLYQLDCLKSIARLDPIVTPWGALHHLQLLSPNTF